jgi:peptidyl-prolyl cis-trans isomerase A (cyclophilin A)
MQIVLSALAAVAVLAFQPAQSAAQTDQPQKKPRAVKPLGQPEGKGKKAMADPKTGIPQGKGDLYAIVQTSAGNITVRLLEKDAPETVANFVGLATGAKEWTDPRTRQKTHAKLYDATMFHRVIPNFMIQGGDPLGTGMGDPGYRFGDEFQSGRKFDKPGLLAMANAGPNTNGSQFFITEVPTPHLNNKHTIFGEVVKGFELVPKIARAGNDKTTLQHVEIVRSEKVP